MPISRNQSEIARMVYKMYKVKVSPDTIRRWMNKERNSTYAPLFEAAKKAVEKQQQNQNLNQ